MRLILIGLKMIIFNFRLAILSLLLLVQSEISSSQATKDFKSDEELKTHIQHPSLFVDTKYWIQNTELTERANWLDHKKPCSWQVDRILLGDQDAESMVVSIGDSYGPLESNINEIVLSNNGVLLLEEDQEPIDRPAHQSNDAAIDNSFAQYLSEIGECTERLHSEQDNSDQPRRDSFKFQPDADDLSWFNPDNWFSTMIDLDDNTNWAPQSHQIPCTEDVVALAGHHVALMTLLEGNEKSALPSFKLNFRPSQYVKRDLFENITVTQLRIAKLKIGQRFYTQKDLHQLVSMYGDSLIEFGGNSSLLNYHSQLMDGDFISDLLPVIIDETSIQADSNYDLCLEEAGCICGNEKPEIMAAICSFHEPLIFPNEYPCEDPIKATGYCDKICATVMTIHMDPNKFSERFVTDLINKLLIQEEDEIGNNFEQHLFSGARRVDYSNYEITFRIVPNDSADYTGSLGRDTVFANLLKDRLEMPATKSFYGIKNIRITSSIRWRGSNKWRVFFISLCLMGPLFSAISMQEEKLSGLMVQMLNVSLYEQQTQTMARHSSGGGDMSTMSDESMLLVEPTFSND